MQWTDFLTIIDDLPTDIKTTTANKPTLCVQNGQTILKGFPIGETITIYTLQGTSIYNQQAYEETVVVTLPAHGVYIVRVGEQSVKVVY